MDIQDQYDRIVAGDTSDDDIKWSRRKLQREALARTSDPDPAARLGALRVAAFIGPVHGLPITAKLMTDGDRKVRVAAFNQAVAAREDGRALLREALTGPDTELALAAADLLARAADRPSLNPALRLLSSDEPGLRAAAARIVGMVGGRSSLARMRVDQESDPGARAAMEEARQRIDGDAERPPAQVWWSAGEVDLPSPAVEGDISPSHTAPEVPATPASPPEGSDEPEDDVVDATFEEVAGADSDRSNAGDASSEGNEGAQLPAAPVSTEVSTPEDDADPPEPAAWNGEATPLPSQLPTEARALCRLLGMVAPSDRETVVAALREIDDPAALGDLWIAWQPGGDLALGRGLALAAAALQRGAFLTKATTLAGVDEPLIRAAAVEAIGALGGASALTRVNRRLTDPAPSVRAAAARALAAMGPRLGREGIASSWLQQAADDDDPEVKTAVSDALEALA